MFDLEMTMRWLVSLLLLFTLGLIIEIYLLFRVGARVGAGPTVAIVLATAIVGAWLARQQGGRAWRRVAETLAQGKLPGREVIETVLILFAGILLVTPGFVTDGMGVVLLVPWTRALIAKWALSRLRLRVGLPARPPATSSSIPDDEVIDISAESREVVDSDTPKLPPRL